MHFNETSMFCWLKKSLRKSIRFYFYDKNPLENPFVFISIIKNAAKRDNAGAVCNSRLGMLFFKYLICLHYSFKDEGGGLKTFFDIWCIMHDAWCRINSSECSSSPTFTMVYSSLPKKSFFLHMCACMMPHTFLPSCQILFPV